MPAAKRASLKVKLRCGGKHAESCSGLQQFACVPAGAVGDLGAGEHARDLFDTATPVEFWRCHCGVTGDYFLFTSR